VAFAADIALLLVAVLVIRKHRPDVLGWFLAWAVVGLLGSIARPVTHTLLMMQPVRPGLQLGQTTRAKP